ncbi:hypothetical protein MMC26_006453 [Xylographa opegraphella]|nr:hypothetical protein [Xylographa opegraphella]
MASEDGENFIKNLAQFVRTHEKALANALQLRRQNNGQKVSNWNNGDTSPSQLSSFPSSTITSSATSALAAAFSLGALSFTSHNIKPAKLTLTPHHLFYLLSRFEELGIAVGPMNVRLENLTAEQSPANYVSFLSHPQRPTGRSDRDSIHSISSVRSALSGISTLWSKFGLSNNNTKTEKAKAQLEIDIKYLYSAFTKIPCLRISPDRKARLIRGYEEFPFDTAVPLLAFKNMSSLEICDVDFRQFFGWDKLAEQLRSLTVKRAHVDDPADLLVGIVLDDMDKRRRRSSKAQSSSMSAWAISPAVRHLEFAHADSTPSSPVLDDKFGRSSSPRNSLYIRGEFDVSVARAHTRNESSSPIRPTSSRQSTYRHSRGNGGKVKRSGSGSSNSSTQSVSSPVHNRSSSNLLLMGILPALKWRFLKHLSLADNSLTSLTSFSFAPLANTLHSLDLSSNLFTDVPDAIATLTALRALNLSKCMIASLHSLARNPLPAISALNLRSNRLGSLAGVERLLSLERLDLRDNKLTDPTETARLTGIPDIRDIWVLNNPFVKSHSNYRVTIFNLFRSTPGYTEDIVIDNAAPGFGERRQLRDRVVESEGVPIVKPMPSDYDHSRFMESKEAPTKNDFQIESRPQRTGPQISKSDAIVSSGRRRKGPRRRIVDLSIDDSQHEIQVSGTQAVPQKSPQVAFSNVDQVVLVDPDQASPRTQLGFPFHQDNDSIMSVPPLLPAFQSARSPAELPLVSPETNNSEESQKLFGKHLQQDLGGATYRQRVQALKGEFGTAWLNVLSHDIWDRQTPEQQTPTSSFPSDSPVKPDMSSMRTTSQGIISSSRTLG